MKPRPPPTLSGELGTTSVASLLWSARQRDLTGTLSIQAECYAGVSPGETLITFKQGALTQIRQPQPLDTLGCVLREQGAITGEQFDESLARMAAREGLQGRILVTIGGVQRRGGVARAALTAPAQGAAPLRAGQGGHGVLPGA